MPHNDLGVVAQTKAEVAGESAAIYGGVDPTKSGERWVAVRPSTKKCVYVTKRGQARYDLSKCIFCYSLKNSRLGLIFFLIKN